MFRGAIQKIKVARFLWTTAYSKIIYLTSVHRQSPIQDLI